MTTLLHLTQSIADMQNELSREQRFSGDARRNLLSGVKLLRDAVDALEKDIVANFDERDRSISRMIGNSQPYATVIENSPAVEEPVLTVTPDKIDKIGKNAKKAISDEETPAAA